MALLLAAVIFLACWVGSLYVWPFAPCGRCQGGGRNKGSNRRRFGDCGACGGSGRRQRFGSRTVHRVARGALDRKRDR